MIKVACMYGVLKINSKIACKLFKTLLCRRTIVYTSENTVVHIFLVLKNICPAFCIMF